MELVKYNKAVFERNKLIIHDSITIDEWKQLGQNLRQVEGSVQFWIGDWARYGDKRGFTGKYTDPKVYDELEEITGLDRGTLKNYKRVAELTSSHRCDDLSFTHHIEVAKLEPELQEYFLTEAAKNHWSVSALREAIKKKEIEDTEKEREEEKRAKSPIIYFEDCNEFLKRFKSKSIDLLITDPPYSTDIDDISEFVDSWIFNALDKIKDTGRAFICIGAYPIEIYTYLQYLFQTEWIIDNPLIWTYRNTLGQTPKMKYNLNYQVILHLYKETSLQLDTRITNEMFSVQDINAPDGRIGDRYHTWQKPMKLAERLILHTTKPGFKIIDPFACTGTFLIAASENNRLAWGCDNDKEAINIAIERGCKNE
jgi:DNA modification methylase